MVGLMVFKESKTKFYFPFKKSTVRLSKCGTKTEPLLVVYWLLRWVMLNKLHQVEKTGDYHSHSHHFISWIVRGGYKEDVIKPNGSIHTKKRKWFNIVNANDMHNVYDIEPNTWTIMFVWPFRKNRGVVFLSEYGTFWTPNVLLMDTEEKYNLKPIKL